MTSVATGVKRKVDVRNFISDINAKYDFVRAVLRDEWRDSDTISGFMRRMKFSVGQRALLYGWIDEEGVPNKEHFDTFRTTLRWEGEKLEQMESLWEGDCERHSGTTSNKDKTEAVRVRDKNILLSRIEKSLNLGVPAGRLFWIVCCANNNSLKKFDEQHSLNIEWYETVLGYTRANELIESGLVDFMFKELQLTSELVLWVLNGIVSETALSKMIEEYRAAIHPPSEVNGLKENGSSGS